MKSPSARIWQLLFAVLAISCIGLGWYCVQLTQENKRSNEFASQAAAARDEAQIELKHMKSELEAASRKSQATEEKLHEELSIVNAELARTRKQLQTYDQIIRGDDQKIKQSEYRQLQNLRDVLSQHLEAQQRILDEIKSAMPKESDWVSEGLDQAKSYLRGRTNSTLPERK